MVTAVSIGTAPTHPLASLALGAAHTALDPIRALHALRRIDAAGGVINDVGERRLAGLLVEPVFAIGDLGDRLMALAERHVDRAADALEFEMLESGDDVLLCRRRLRLARLVIGRFEP